MSGAVIPWGCVSGLRVPIQHEITEKRAQIESNRPVESEFRIDHPSVTVRDHHRTGMKIAVQERLSLAEKFLSKLCRGDFQRSIATKIRDDVVQLGRGVAIAFANKIRIRKNKIYRNADQRLVSGEQRYSIEFVFEGLCAIGSEEATAGDKLAHVAGKIWVTASCDQSMTQDDVRG